MEIPIRPHPPGVNGDWRRLSKGHWLGGAGFPSKDAAAVRQCRPSWGVNGFSRRESQTASALSAVEFIRAERRGHRSNAPSLARWAP